jgi:hypothetical protein
VCGRRKNVMRILFGRMRHVAINITVCCDAKC